MKLYFFSNWINFLILIKFVLFVLVSYEEPVWETRFWDFLRFLRFHSVGTLSILYLRGHYYNINNILSRISVSILLCPHAKTAKKVWNRSIFGRKWPKWPTLAHFGSDLSVIDLKYFENFYGALSLYFWAFEATLESEYVSSQNADFNLWNVLTQIFRQKLKKSSEKGFSFILFKKEVFHFNSFHPYLGQLLQSLHQQDKGDAGKSATSSSYNAATSRALPLSYNTFLSVKRQDSSWIQT